MIATYTYDVLGGRIEIKDSGTQTWAVFNGTSADADRVPISTVRGA